MAEHSKEGFRVKITKKNVSVLLIVVLLAFFAYILYNYLQPIIEINYGNVILGFREDLREAEKVPITPDEIAFNREFINSLVENVTIVFKPTNDETESFYSIEAFEIVNKLYYGYRRINHIPNFQTRNVTSYEGVFGGIKNPVIILVHPKYGNETSVKLDFHTAIISAKNDDNPNVALKNFDLATERFIIAALGINI